MLTHLNVSGLVRVVDEPVLSFTPNQTAIVKFTVVANSAFQNSDGQKVEETCFINCIAWSKRAESINKYVAKGDPLYFEGQLKQETWSDKEGKNHNRHLVRIGKVTFIKSKD